MMRRTTRNLLIGLAALPVLGGGAYAGWHLLGPRDPLAAARQYEAKGDLKAAELELRQAVQADPGLAEAHYRLGKLQLLLGDPIAAERELRSARDRGWNKAAITPLLAQAVVAQHRDAEALADYTADGLPPPEAAGVWLARGQAELDLHHPSEAAQAIEAAIRLAPQTAAPRLAAARLALVENDRKAADARIGEALAIAPHDLDALILQAQLRNAEGDQAGALASYAAALDAAAHSAPGAALGIRLSRATLLVAMGKDADANADIDAVLAAVPKQPVANFLRARLLAKAGDWKGADAALLNVGALLPRLPNGELLLAVVKTELNQPEQAVEAAQRQVARTPDNLPALKLLARLEFARHRPDLAAAALASAGTALDAEALDMMSEAYAADGKQGKAVAALRQASARLPDDAGLLTRLAAMELREGEPGKAVDALQRALDAEQAKPGAATPSVLPNPPAEADTAGTLVLAALRAGELGRAEAALARMRTANGDPARIAELDGLIKVAQADFSGAHAAFATAVTLDPKNLQARLDLAHVMAVEGDVDGAAGMLRAVLADAPGNLSAVDALIDVYLQAGRPADALAAAEAAHAASPGDPTMTADLATLALATGDAAKALAVLDAAPQQKGPAARPLRGLHARAELALGHRDAATAELRDLLAEEPDNQALRRELAAVLAGSKDYAAAQAVLAEGLAAHPNDPALLAASVALANAEGGPAAAVARAGALAKDPGAALLQGDVLMAQRHYAEAAAAYAAKVATLPASDPRQGVALLREAQADAAAGQADAATALLSARLAAYPDDLGARLAMASLDIAANRLAPARSALQGVLAQQPGNVVALNNLAWVDAESGDLAAAKTLAQRAYLLQPSPQAADTLGWVLFKLGNTADARPLLGVAAKGAPADPSIAYHYAAALAQSGSRQEAATRLKALLAAAPHFAEQAQAAKLLAELQS